ncbi:nucleotide exchange factor GrpE [Candidatus Falkowbacteria bacterium]|jgi:molecular chaperone GrpE|nr:nucleotide exchange factor GrpE [Candidatus Falkowbacteria bacterium]MBT5503347.1 nucleotide exchange factor GrpE [Candidatus Falkowbacteria bacterium]MBT6573677.1 nucleotide exchange factor GrpE [Candidatus Falkowbacteria bacterium]MBT7500148.1 nucleotide exchange factor GrpE [Candidatus Falkowbacteria bacterium]
MTKKKENKKAKKQLSKLEKLEQQSVEYLDGWKRAQADYQNLIKESEEKRKEYVKYANANLIVELLPILDNFKTAFNQIPENDKDSPWVVGFGYIKKQLEDFLQQNGVECIKTVGEQFDPSLHEAVENNVGTDCDPSATPNETSADEGEIIKEIRSGYTLNNKVVQVAKVIVNHSE